MEVFSKYKYPGYKTKAQWQKEYKIIRSEKGAVECWTNQYCNQYTTYYPPSAVRDITESDVKRMYNKIKSDERFEKMDKLRHEVKTLTEENKTLQKENRVFINAIYKLCQIAEPLKEDTPKTICMYLKTTGYDCYTDEIVQITIIDENENILLDEYIKPYEHTKWKNDNALKADPETVMEQGKYMHEIISKLKNIIGNADTIIGYSTQFEINFLKWYVPIKNKKIVSVMEDFADVYGEWNDYYGNYKYQKLTTCAAYYKYDHTVKNDTNVNLLDAKTTLNCWKEMNKTK